VITATIAATAVKTAGIRITGHNGGRFRFALTFLFVSRLGEGGRMGYGVGNVVDGWESVGDRWMVRERRIVRAARREQRRKITQRIRRVQ